MTQQSLAHQLDCIARIPGWFSPDAAILFTAYNQLLRESDLAGDVLEIGVYHGKSAVLLASFPGKERSFVAIDLFEDLQSFDADGAGAVGMKEAFLQNLRAYHGATPSLRVVAASSASLTARDVPGDFTFCHIDGDHSQKGTYADFDLCYQILRPGGIIAVDDYFNQMFPGVAEGGLRWSLDHPRALAPVAIGYNKAIFHKPLRGFDINARFTKRFKSTPHGVTQLWDEPVYLFTAGLASHIDTQKSSATALVPKETMLYRARIEPAVTQLRAERGKAVRLSVCVVNESGMTFEWGIALSYHIMRGDGSVHRWENGRSMFDPPLDPAHSQVIGVGIDTPGDPGRYLLEFDLVCEHVTWFADQGNPTATVHLEVV
jgi:Methyltransferase domain